MQTMVQTIVQIIPMCKYTEKYALIHINMQMKNTKPKEKFYRNIEPT